MANNEKWQHYYQKYKNKKNGISLIEWANKNIFSPAFLSEFYKIGKNHSGLNILEPGCGSGVMSSVLAQKNKVSVLDISENALEVTKQNFKKNNVKGEFIKGDIFAMPFDDNTFDIVWNQGVLEHFDDPEKAMKDMMRVVKKGGYSIMFLPAFFSPLHIVYIILTLLRLKKIWPFDDQSFFTAPKFKNFLELAGFKNYKVKRLWIQSLNFSQVGYCKKI